jgi:alpha-galactosidase
MARKSSKSAKHSKSTRRSQPTAIKIAYIGGGSRGWAHVLMNDLARCPDLTGEVRLFDIDKSMARLNARWAKRVNESPDAVSKWQYKVSDSLETALKGVDFVVASIQPGPIEMMGSDLEIPRKYGLLHTVGDTVGPAGLVRGLRSVGEYVTIAQAVAEHCPDAWVINYTNPMSICTRTLYRVFPDVKAFGCCHEVFNTQKKLARLVETYHGVLPARQEIKVNPLGVNHFTWVDRAFYKDINLLELFAQHIEKEPVKRDYSDEEIAEMDCFANKGQVTKELFSIFGIMPTGGERHIVEFLPWFLRDERTLHRYGVRCTPYSFRIGRYTEKPKDFRKRLADKTPFEVKPSDEEGVAQMKAILGMGDLHTNVNLPNIGQIDGLPLEAVVETNAFFTRDSVKPEIAGALPPGVHTHVDRACTNQETIVEAALEKDKYLAFEAVLNDPLTLLPVDEAWKMFNEMLRATKAMLPGWKL